MTLDTTTMCSHLQKKLFEDDAELTVVVRSRQLHIYLIIMMTVFAMLSLFMEAPNSKLSLLFCLKRL